jgi:glucose dehydrogenase
MLAGSAFAQTDWPVYGHDPGGQRYSPLTQITPKNVATLKRVWTFHTGEQVSNTDYRGQKIAAFESTPLVIGNVLYFSTPGDRVIALNAETGELLWRFDAQAGRAKIQFHSHRGVSYWPGDATNPARILFGTQEGQMIALGAKTGQPVPGFGDEGRLDLRKGVAGDFPRGQYSITSPPAIYRDLLITGAAVPEAAGAGPKGDVRAFDIHTGKLAWQFRTWTGDPKENRTGVNVWSIMTVDTERGIVYLPIGSATYDFYGGDRKGAGLYANCLVALNAATGKMLWHYQVVHHDLWDYDLPAPPALVTVKRGGLEIPAVAQVTKMGLVFLFDRVTGEPIYPIEEEPVPKSTVPGEQSWPTQPIPALPPPLSRSTVTADEITNVTPESHRFCAELFSHLQSQGRFTPWGTELTVVFPGTLGGGTWSGGSFDPARGYLFVNANEIGAIGQMAPQPDGAPSRYRRTSPQGDYARFWDDRQLPCQQPPWGTLTAIDVNTGQFAWRVPLGITEGIKEKTGSANLGGSIATAGGLVFIGATNDSRFRAFDSATGAELWVTKLEASGHATPITYLGRNGKQYVAIAAGGGGFFSPSGSDTLAAFALP